MSESPGAILHKQEPLDSAFRSYLHEDGSLGPYIQHPLFYSVPHFEELNALANRALREKQRAVNESRGEGNWFHFLALHEKPWRITAFLEIMEQLSEQQYWELLRWVWIDTENLWQSEAELADLLTEERPQTQLLMNEKERRLLAGLPETVRIYRGYHEPARQQGLSWSLSKEIASWFAGRYKPGQALLAEAEVSRSQIIAYLTGRDEQEIIALPENVRILAVQQL